MERVSLVPAARVGAGSGCQLLGTARASLLMKELDMGTIAESSASARLMETNEEYRTLVEEHTQYDDRLDDLGSRVHLTTEEEVEEHQLKKLKLLAKDRMYAMLREHEAQAS
ncbi:MAG: DUF465 domain-containing protein [Acidobacteria bacterium]|nr:DUF465 domain-containing protein [Acidobacteriota bacterium]